MSASVLLAGLLAVFGPCWFSLRCFRDGASDPPVFRLGLPASCNRELQHLQVHFVTFVSCAAGQMLRKHAKVCLQDILRTQRESAGQYTMFKPLASRKQKPTESHVHWCI